MNIYREREQEGIGREKEQLNHQLVLFILLTAAWHQHVQNHYGTSIK